MAKRNVKNATAKKAATTARKSSAVSAFAHWPLGSTAYVGLTGDARQVIICAAMVVSGFAKMNKANIGKGAKGNPKLFERLVGKRPLSWHRAESRIVDNALTAEGLVWFQHRVNSADRIKLTNELINAMTKGGSAGGLEFAHKITV